MTAQPHRAERIEVTELLVAAARSGDHAAIGALAGEAFRTIVTFYRYTGVSANDAEDLAADAVERIITKLPTLKQASAYDAWMWSITRNLLRSFWRDKRRPQVVEPGTPEPAGPEELAILGEEHAAIISALSTLPLKDRELLWLRDVQGLEYTEIAHRVQSTSGGVRVAVYRARKRLQNAYRSADTD